jgi:hypothetical protein
MTRQATVVRALDAANAANRAAARAARLDRAGRPADAHNARLEAAAWRDDARVWASVFDGPIAQAGAA